MKRFIIFAFALLFCIGAFAQNKTNLKVLYVGGTSDYEKSTPELIADRTVAFEQYLNNYFSSVTVIDGKNFKEDMSANYDVTIFDGPIPCKSPRFSRKASNGEENYYAPKYLSEGFNYPAILIANTSESLGRSIGVKTDWYCLCLDADAHHMNTGHPIFKGPYKTKLTISDKPTPEDAFHYEYYTGKLPSTTPMWKVQTKGYIADKGFRVGMVARPWGFTDSPEAEVISSGVCAKTIDAVAIGRHGNFFFWGFSASPKYMTDEAKQVFANAVVYTATLEGSKVIARKYYDRAATKEYIKEMTYLSTKKAFEEYVISNTQFYDDLKKQKRLAEAKKAKGEKLTDDDNYALQIDTSNMEVINDYAQYLKKRMREYYDVFGTDVEAFHKFLKDNEPYLYGAAMFYKFIVDEDVKSLGIANTDIKLLDKAISMLENGVDCEKAQRILDRYTLCTFSKPSDWRKWYNTYKDKLFFTQSGGYYFLVNTTDPSVPGNDYIAKGIYLEARDLSLEETTDNSPVAVAAKEITLAGGNQFVIVKMRIRNGYHIYGRVSDQDPFIPTKIALELPEGYSAGTMKIPAGTLLNNTGTVQYTGDVLFTIPIYGDTKGKITLNYQFQCCDSQVCLPPVEGKIQL